MNVLVTGGGGFLGSHLACRLHEMGHCVSVLGRRRYPFLPSNIIQIQADLRDPKAVSNACREQNSVFHAGALPGIWGRKQDFYQINVDGTQHVIEGCLEHGVEKLVFTSSPSVIFNQTDMENVDESVPYPSSYLSDYPKTKALAERKIIAANDRHGLLTVSLRPHLIWGPGDPHLVPRIIERAKKGQLIRVGGGTNRVDIVYIDNAVDGHIQAWQALHPGSTVAGKCYFLSDGEPVVLWNWINQLLTSLGINPVTKSISYGMAKNLGRVLEGIYRIFGFAGEPRMTRFLAGQLATSHFFDISRARKDFNYQVRVTPEEGMKRLLKSLEIRPEC